MRDYFIKKYLTNRPMFLAVIRTPEALLFQKYLKLIKKPVLDFGCGDGFFAETVFGREKIDVGLDLKNSRAKTAEKNQIYKKVVYYGGNKIQFTNSYFSSIVSNCVLEHIPNLKQSLKQIKRVLKPNGYFLTTVMTNNWNNYLFGKKLLGKVYIDYMQKKQEHFNLLTIKQWNNLFRETGFKIVKTIGYLDKKNSSFMDLAHYLSLPSLVSYKLFNNLQIFPKLNIFLWKNYIIKKINISVSPKKSSGLFFILKNEKN